MNCFPQDAQVRTTRLSFSSSLGCFFHHAFLHFTEQKRWLALALSGSRFPHMAHFRTPGCFCRCTNTFSAETSIPSSAEISLYCLPAARMSKIVLFSFSVIEKTSSRLVAARGGKKGRFRLFDCDAVLAPEKELRAAVGVDRHLRDQQAPCLFIPNVDGTSLTTEVLHISVNRFSIVFCKFS